MDRKSETAPVIPGRTDSDESTVRCLAAKNVVEQHFSELAQHNALTRAEEIASLRQKYAATIGGQVENGGMRHE